MSDRVEIRDADAFIEFLESGRLGLLHPKLLKADIYRVLGEPDFVKHIGPSQEDIKLRYGNIGIIILCPGEILFIDVDYRLGPTTPPSLQVQWPDAVKNVSLEQMRSFLRQANIPYKRAVKPDYWESVILVVTESGSELIFDREQGSITQITFISGGPFERRLTDDV